MRYRFKDKSKWHKWFAWRPIYMWEGDQMVWLETVETRCNNCYKQYRLPEQLEPFTITQRVNIEIK